MMTIAAVPAYLGTDFKEASPALRFGMYLQVWADDFSVVKEKVEPLKQAGKLNQNDVSTMQNLLQRQQAAFNAMPAQADSLQLDAIASAPFTTGLGNEHPLENGFAFLNPYGLPYLPGSGVKGVLRQAARELASGDWGDSHGWDQAAITALFGLESQDGETELQRGALTFWDVIPQIKGDSLKVEIMTPHQKHYYQNDQTPHDSGMPVPLGFLTVPPGSGFTFHVTCDSPFLRRLAGNLAEQDNWKTLLQAAFDHAFSWLGFGAKTAVGYGAMAEDAAKKAERAQQLKQQQEAARRSQMNPEDAAYEDNRSVIEPFRAAFEKARKAKYQPGQGFDNDRNKFIDKALTWDEPRSRREAAELLAETIQWGVSKKGKERLNSFVEQLKADPE